MSRSLVVGAVVTAALCGRISAQENATLRGEVLTRDGSPAVGVRLFITGHPPEVVIRGGGLFSHPLTGSPAEISARVAGSGEVGIIYPSGGRVPVPGDASTPVTIIVGEPLGPGVLEAIERQQTLMRETLASRGVAQDAIEAALDADIQGLLQELGRMNRELVSEVRNEAEQAVTRREIAETLTSYRRRLWDLLVRLQELGPTRDMGTGTQLGLREVMRAYSQTYETLDTRRPSMVDGVRRYWPEAESDVLGATLESTLTLVLETFHARVLELNHALVVIQLEVNDGTPSNSEVQAAEEAVRTTTTELQDRLPTLELALNQLLDELGIQPGGVE